MDASVNMKMTPNEHRLLVECVDTRIEDLHEAIRTDQIGPALRREAREKEARLRDLRTKL